MSRFQEVLDRLENVTLTAENQAKAQCPVHKGQGQSLSVGERNGKILFHCFARGCDYKEIVQAIGLDKNDGFGWREVVDYYNYEDQEGNIMKRKVRYFPKGFAWQYRRIDPVTKEEIWEWGEGNYKDLPYHLPDLIKAIQANRRVIICEGEKDADNTTEFCSGFAQGTTLGAAVQSPNDPRLNGLDWLEEYNDIVVIPDNDGAGANNVKFIANRLVRRGARVRIVRLDGDRIKDISDWIAKNTFFRFEELVKNTPYTQISENPLGYLRMNYTLVDIGGKTLALNLRALDEGRLVTTSHDNFMHGYGTRTITVKEGKQEKKVKVGPIWWEQQVNEVGILKLVYKPGEEQVREDELNLWRGWGVQPSEKGSCELFKEHLLKIVCKNNEVYYKYLWDWMADMFQNPTARRGIIVGLRGIEGAGKSFIGEFVLRRLLGTGYYLLDNSKILDSQFNEYMVNRLLVHLEEAFFSGSYSVKSYFKSISTSEILQINPKGLPTFTVKNYLKLFVTSNADWMLPVDWRDRRYFVLDAAPDRANDREYFAAIREQLENGGFERLLWELLDTEITSDWSKIPSTEAKTDQIMLGQPILLWWDDCKQYSEQGSRTVDPEFYVEGEKEESDIYVYDGEKITPTRLYEKFMSWARKTQCRGNLPKSVGWFARDLKKLLGLESKEENIKRGNKETTEKNYTIDF